MIRAVLHFFPFAECDLLEAWLRGCVAPAFSTTKKNGFGRRIGADSHCICGHARGFDGMNNSVMNNILPGSRLTFYKVVD